MHTHIMATSYKSRCTVATKSKILPNSDIKFSFFDNSYKSSFAYGLENRAFVTVVLSESPRTGCCMEEVYVSLPGILPGHMKQVTYFTPDDAEFAKYGDWDLTLCPLLTAHLMAVVDRILESFEKEVYRQRRKTWRLGHSCSDRS